MIGELSVPLAGFGLGGLDRPVGEHVTVSPLRAIGYTVKDTVMLQ